MSGMYKKQYKRHSKKITVEVERIVISFKAINENEIMRGLKKPLHNAKAQALKISQWAPMQEICIS